MRDYAKKPIPPTQKKPVHQQNWFANAMLLLAFVFLGYAIDHFFHHHSDVMSPIAQTVKQIPVSIANKIKQHHDKKLSAHSKKTTATKTKISIEKKAASQSTASNQPKYDFYKLLPEMAVTVSGSGSGSGNN